MSNYKNTLKCGTWYELHLPFPPSINGYWRSIKRGKICAQILSEKGRDYKKTVAEVVGKMDPFEGRIGVYMELCPPDRRKRDIDNYVKAVLDSLTECGVWIDDSQIDVLCVERGELTNKVYLQIGELD